MTPDDQILLLASLFVTALVLMGYAIGYVLGFRAGAGRERERAGLMRAELEHVRRVLRERGAEWLGSI